MHNKYIHEIIMKLYTSFDKFQLVSTTQIEALSNLFSSCIQRLCVGPAAVSYVYIDGVESVTLSD